MVDVLPNNPAIFESLVVDSIGINLLEKKLLELVGVNVSHDSRLVDAEAREDVDVDHHRPIDAQLFHHGFLAARAVVVLTNIVGFLDLKDLRALTVEVALASHT